MNPISRKMSINLILGLDVVLAQNTHVATEALITLHQQHPVTVQPTAYPTGLQHPRPKRPFETGHLRNPGYQVPASFQPRKRQRIYRRTETTQLLSPPQTPTPRSPGEWLAHYRDTCTQPVPGEEPEGIVIDLVTRMARKRRMADDEILTPEKRETREQAGLQAYYAKESQEMLDLAEDNEPSDDEEPEKIPEGKVWDPIRELWVDRKCMDDFEEELKRDKLRWRWNNLMEKRREDRGAIPWYRPGDSELEFSDFEEEKKKRRGRMSKLMRSVGNCRC